MIFASHLKRFRGWNADDADRADFHRVEFSVIREYLLNQRVQLSIIEHE